MAGINFVIASNLREMRKAKGMRQHEIAKILGESQSKVSAIETGERPPDLETLIRFCDIYSTDPNVLLAGGYQRILGDERDCEEKKTTDKSSEEKPETSPAVPVEQQQAASDGCNRCDLYDKLVQAQERENALLRKENAALDAKNKELSESLSLCRSGRQKNAL